MAVPTNKKNKKLTQISFLIWNLNKNTQSLDTLKILLIDLKIDILLLNEVNDDIKNSNIWTELNFHQVGQLHKKAHFYSRLENTIFSSANDANFDYLNFCVLHFDSIKILIVGLHLPSKLYRDNSSQLAIVKDCRTAIQEQSKLAHTDNIICLGDFNMNPSDSGMIEPQGFNSVSDKILSFKDRTFNGVKYKRFYNPMFSLLGDFKYGSNIAKIAGSYFLNNAKNVTEHNWNMLDQVITSGNISNYLYLKSIKLVDKIADFEFIEHTNNSYKFKISDHLPLTFKIKIP